MKTLVLALLLAAPLAAPLAALPALAQPGVDAIVVLADDGALSPQEVRAIRSVAQGELRRRGLTVSADRRTDAVMPVDSALSALAAELGARRLFAVRVSGRLGHKIPLGFEELAPATLTSIYSAQLTATGIEEADTVTVRLVQAVLDRKSADATAEMRTVTASESKPFAKRPGERFFFIGLPIALFNGGSSDSPLGLTLSYGYEAESFRLMATAGGFGRGNSGVGLLALEGAWIPFSGEFSPFVGGGFGFMGANDRGGMGLVAEGGIEAFRLHSVRGLLGVQLAIPLFDARMTSGTSSTPTSPRRFFPAAFVRFGF